MQHMARAIRTTLVMALALSMGFMGSLPAKAQEKDGDHPPVPRAAPLKPVEVAEALEPPREGVIVFGGNRATGLEVVKALVARGEKVTVMVRPTSNTAELDKLGVTTVKGDAMNAEDVAKAASSAYFRAAVTTLGGTGANDAGRPDFDGNKNVVDAAKAAGIPRVVLVTVIGTGTSKSAAPYFSRYVLRKVFPLKEQAENYLMASGLKYTIIRPGGLLDRPAEGKSVLTEDPEKFSWMIRADLGKLTADTLYDGMSVNKVYTAFDPTRDSLLSGLMDRMSESKKDKKE